MKWLGTFDNPTVFGWFQMASVVALGILYIQKMVGGGKNPVIAGNPFDSDNVLAFPQTMGDLTLHKVSHTPFLGWTLFNPVDAPTPHGKAFTSCNCGPGEST